MVKDKKQENIQQKSKKKGSLTTKIFIALILGMLCGIMFYSFVPNGYVRDEIFLNGIFYILGNGFIRAMKMLVVPLVLCSLVCGVMAIDDTKKIGSVGLRTLLFYIATTAIAVVIALSVANIINPGVGVDLTQVEQVETSIEKSSSFGEVVLNIIPENPFNSLSSGSMLQVIFFALFLGIVLAHLGDKAKTIAKLFHEGNAIMMFMTEVIMKFAPIGVFCLIASTFATIGWGAFGSLLKYMLAVFIALGIQCFIIYMLFLKGFTKLNPIIFLKKFFPVMGFAFSTATSTATIPLSIETLDKKLGVSKKISSFTIPLGATINMDGTSIMQGVAVVFIAQLYGVQLSISDYITVIATATLASVGTAGIPSVGLITLSMVLSSVGLPIEGIGWIMGIDRILDMTRTAVNITGDAVCTAIVAHHEGAIDREVFNKDFDGIDLDDIASIELD